MEDVYDIRKKNDIIDAGKLQKKARKQRSPGDEFGLAKLFWFGIAAEIGGKIHTLYEEEIAELHHWLKTEQ